jgi:small subunit ribosomal protein S16
MLRIRLKRQGAKRNPIYRIIVIDRREKREGAPIEQIGFYNPRKKELRLDKAKAAEWIKKGAQPSDTVGSLIKNSDDNGNLIIKKVAEEQKLSKKAKAKIEAEAKAKADAEAKAKAEAEAAKEAEKKAKEEAAAKAKEEAEQAKAAEAAAAETPVATEEPAKAEEETPAEA